MLEMSLKTANLACSKMPLLQVIWRTPSQDLEVFCVFSDPERLFRFLICARSNQQSPAAVKKRKSYRLMKVYKYIIYQRVRFWHAYWGLICAHARGNPRLERNDSHSNSASFAKNYASLRTSITFRQLLSTSPHLTQLYLFEENAAVIHMTLRGRRLNWRHVTRTHSVDLDWLFDRFNLDLSIFITYVRTDEQLTALFTTESFSSQQRQNSLQLTLYILRRISSHILSSQLFWYISVFARFSIHDEKEYSIDIDSSTKYFAHDDKRVRGESTQSIEKWSQHSSRFLESWSKLGSKRSFDRLKNHTFQCMINIILLLAGLISQTQWKDAFQLRDFLLELPKDSACTGSTPMNEQMSKLERAEMHVLSDPVLWLIKAAMNEASEIFTMKCVGFFANEKWYCRWKVTPATGNCEPFTVHVLCLPWRCRRRDQVTDPTVAGTVSNTGKLYKQSHAHAKKFSFFWSFSWRAR